MVGKERFTLNRPFFATIFLALHESLPDKIAGCHADGQGNIRKVGCRCQRQCARCRCTHNTDFADTVVFQPVNCCLHTLQWIVVMAVILFRRRHGEYVYAASAKPFRSRAGKPVLRIVSDHSDHHAVRSAGARPIRAVEAGGLHIKVQVLHCFPLNLIFTICMFIIPSPTRARKRKKPLTDGPFRSL